MIDETQGVQIEKRELFIEDEGNVGVVVRTETAGQKRRFVTRSFIIVRRDGDNWQELLTLEPREAMAIKAVLPNAIAAP